MQLTSDILWYSVSQLGIMRNVHSIRNYFPACICLRFPIVYHGTNAILANQVYIY